MSYAAYKSQIDDLWSELSNGGITDAIEKIKHISYFSMMRIIDLKESKKESQAEILRESYEGVFTSKDKDIRWSNICHVGGTSLLNLMRDEVFKFFRESESTDYLIPLFFNNANLIINDASSLTKVVEAVNKLPLLESNSYKAMLFEYLVSKLPKPQDGEKHKFPTPRHLTDTIVQLAKPTPTNLICDPACGTGGFLVSALNYLYKNNTSEDAVYVDAEGIEHYSGDQLEFHKSHIQSDLITGFDFDSSMIRIGAMNLILHGIESPNLYQEDFLSEKCHSNHSQETADYFDLALTNIPFNGDFNSDSVATSLTQTLNGTKSEQLFPLGILKMLKSGGRAFVIVPDGLLFGDTAVTKGVRKLLIENHGLDAVISLPNFSFKPYSSTSTAILVFTKNAETQNVWFYRVENDGFTTGDARTPQPGKNDLPDLINQFHSKDSNDSTSREGKYFWVSKEEVVSKDYDLSYNKYSEVAYEETTYDDPEEIMARIAKMDLKILRLNQKVKRELQNK